MINGEGYSLIIRVIINYSRSTLGSGVDYDPYFQVRIFLLSPVLEK
jgi:hypothetical protein